MEDGQIYLHGNDVAKWMDGLANNADDNYCFQTSKNMRVWANDLRRFILDMLDRSC